MLFALGCGFEKGRFRVSYLRLKKSSGAFFLGGGWPVRNRLDGAGEIEVIDALQHKKNNYYIFIICYIYLFQDFSLFKA